MPTSSGTIGGDELPIDVSAVYAEHRREPRTINSPNAFVDLLAGMSTSGIRFVAIRVANGTATLRITTDAGADQLISISDLFVVSNPARGSEITALAIQGVVNVEYLVSGDS